MTPNQPHKATMTLTELLEKHHEFAHALDSSVPNQNDFRFAGLGAIVEIAEALQNLPWRPWRASGPGHGARMSWRPRCRSLQTRRGAVSGGGQPRHA